MKKSKRIISLMLSLLMIISMLPAGAFSASAHVELTSGSCGATATYTFDDATGLLTISGTGMIEGDLFKNRSDIKSVVIEEGITSFDRGVFIQCKSLESVSIPSSVESIADSAFFMCEALKNIEIPNGVKSIGSNALNNCLSLVSIKIPNSVEFIGEGAFSHCHGLTSINISAGVTSIGNSAFYNCRRLTSINIPAGVTSIGNMAFWGCEDLTSIKVEPGNEFYDSRDNCNAIIETATNKLISGCKSTIIPNSVTSIGDYAFAALRSLTNIEIPNSVTSIDKAAFKRCSSLESVSIPSSVTSIGAEAFSNCIALTNIEILNGVTSIGEFTFYSCGALKSIEIPKSVTNIDGFAFDSCTSLNDITILNKDCAIFDSADIIENTTTIHGYKGSTAEAYATKYNRTFIEMGSCGKTATYEFNTKTGELVISGTGMVHAPTLFTGNANIKKVVINDGITKVNYDVFKNCTGITEVTFPNSLTEFGDYAFNGCTSLTTVNIPPQVKYINYGVFSGCTALTDVYVYSPDVTYQDTNLEEKLAYPKTTTIHAAAGSSTEKFANNKGYNFVALNIQTGKAGPTADYILYTDSGLLYVYGTGAINDQAFRKNTSIKSVVIGNGITNLGNSAFNSCTALTGIDIPKGVTSIGSYIFANCTALTSIDIPKGVTSIPACAFGSCSSLTSVTMPNSVTSIGYHAFDCCTALTNIDIPNSVTSIDVSAFLECTSLTDITVADGNTVYDSRDNCNAIIETATNTLISGCKNTVIPNSVTSIGDYAFKKCTALTNIEIPNSITSIGEGAFMQCFALKSISLSNCITSIPYDAFSNCTALTSVTIPNSVTSIGERAFHICPSLTSVTIPNSVTSIGRFAFNGCTGLTSIDIPNSVTSIGLNAFTNCTSLKSVKIPKSVTSIGNSAFGACSSLTNIAIFNKDCVIYDYTGTINDTATIHGYKGSTAEAYATKYGRTFAEFPKCGPDAYYYLDESTGELTIFGTGAINDNAFKQNTSIKSVFIEEGITSIGNSAFKDCTALTNIYIPNSTKSIGMHIFEGCTALTSIDIPKGVTSIPTYTFSNCSSLRSVTIPNSVTSIKICAFNGCTGLTNIEIPNGVTSIDVSAFEGCTGLTNIEIPNSVTKIEHDAFESCTGLTSIEIPNSVTNIGSAFTNCTALTDITVATGNTVYDSRDNCNAIIETATNTLISGCKNTVIPNSVTSIGNYAFYKCTGLTNIEIPNSVTSILCGAFQGCTGLKSIEIPNSVTIIGDDAFLNCISFKSVKIPKSVTSIGIFAFDGCGALTDIAILNNECDIYDNAYTINQIATIHGYKGSTAEAYATKYSRPFVAFPKCGPDAYYYLDESTGELTIFGTGAINDNAFKNNIIIKSVFIEEGITSIGNSAFKDCTALTNIDIPKGVTSIGADAFCMCSLVNVEIPNSVTSIGKGAFEFCISLTDITILNKECAIFDSANTISDTATIHGIKGSTAESYATKYNRTFERYICDVHTDGTPVKENEVKPTLLKDGSYDLVTYCTVCGEVTNTEHIVVPMLTDCKITVVDEGLGSVTGLNFGENTVKKDAEFTITVEALPGAEFLGWYINNNLVCTDLTYTGVATSDLTINPKFQEIGSELIDVTFIDRWGNIVAQFNDVKPEAFQLEMQNGIPTTSNVGGYKFLGWDLTNDQILNLNHSQTIRAKYELEQGGYTITTNAQKMTIGSGQPNGQIAFDTFVSLYDPDATVWKIGEVIVGYGNTYSFYVGSNVEIQPFNDTAATEKPTTTIINTSLEDDGVLVDFLATRTVPEGFTLVDSGFVFGKTVDTNALVVENANQVVDGVNIRISLCTKGGADQFLLPYGLRAKAGTIGVKSFVTYKTADGEIQTVYSEVAQYTYAPNA